jgi:hypothetical protein
VIRGLCDRLAWTSGRTSAVIEPFGLVPFD